jgi:hypothetical protein
MAETKYDVIVVGSGASGGWAAKMLADSDRGDVESPLSRRCVGFELHFRNSNEGNDCEDFKCLAKDARISQNLACCIDCSRLRQDDGPDWCEGPPLTALAKAWILRLAFTLKMSDSVRVKK